MPFVSPWKPAIGLHGTWTSPFLAFYRTVFSLKRYRTNIMQASTWTLKWSHFKGHTSIKNRICCCSVVQSCLILCDPMDYSMPGFPVLHHLSELAQTHVYWVGDAIQPFHLLLSSSPPAFSLSQLRVFSNELVFHIKWPKYWSFSFSISSSNEYSGLIFFRIDWFDLFVVQGTLKSLLEHSSSKASIPCHSPSFMVQLSHPYITTGKTIALTELCQ